MFKNTSKDKGEFYGKIIGVRSLLVFHEVMTFNHYPYFSRTTHSSNVLV